jgi:hypothetical protein
MHTKTLDIKTFSDQLFKNMKTELESVGEDNLETIARASKSLPIIKSAVGKLKEYVYEYEFASKGEEIIFFKVVKPTFTSQYYYFEKLLSMKVNEPVNGVDTLKTYYYRELDILQEYIRTHQEFYKYCVSDSTQFDEQYFLRENNSINCVEVDCRFSTGYDNILAMIHTNQLIKDHLQSLIRRIDSDHAENGLTWTGTKTSLIELIYALHGMEVINGGKTDIKQIATSFENFFKISLGNYYRHFQEIKLRKNGHKNFIDQLKEKLSKRLDDLE